MYLLTKWVELKKFILIFWAIFTLILVIVPNTKVKVFSALFGGIIAGTMFQLLQTGYEWLFKKSIS